MSYLVHTIDWHEQQIKRTELMAQNAGADPVFVRHSKEYHRFAIELLRNGNSIGINGPATLVPILKNKNGRELDARLVKGSKGPAWRLSDREQKRFHGRRLIPASETPNERLFAGCVQENKMVPCSRILRTNFDEEGRPTTFMVILDAKKGV